MIPAHIKLTFWQMDTDKHIYYVKYVGCLKVLNAMKKETHVESRLRCWNVTFSLRPMLTSPRYVWLNNSHLQVFADVIQELLCRENSKGKTVECEWASCIQNTGKRPMAQDRLREEERQQERSEVMGAQTCDPCRSLYRLRLLLSINEEVWVHGWKLEKMPISVRLTL